MLESFFNLINLFKTRKALIFEMFKREFGERYAGQWLGMAWVIINPLLLVILYIFVFTCIFSSRSNFFSSQSDYIVYLLCGFIPWLSIQELMNRACSVINQNSNLVKQIIFPLEVLPLKLVLVTFFTQIISSCFMLTYIWIMKGFHICHLLLPLCWIVQLLFMVGISYLLSAIGVYFRDLKDVILFLCSINIFLAPIFYNEQMVPKFLRFIFYLNPVSYICWSYQDILYFNNIERPIVMLMFLAISFMTFILGQKLFLIVKNSFADCL